MFLDEKKVSFFVVTIDHCCGVNEKTVSVSVCFGMIICLAPINVLPKFLLRVFIFFCCRKCFALV